jgi:Leucine-rich repeat (LRR) protein
MRSNYLTFLRAGSFASLNKLKRLDLSKNRFTFLSNNAFVGLDSLRLLNLSSNQFVHVPSTSFHSLAASLETLDMSRNLLAQLMPGEFGWPEGQCDTLQTLAE